MTNKERATAAYLAIAKLRENNGCANCSHYYRCKLDGIEESLKSCATNSRWHSKDGLPKEKFGGFANPSRLAAKV